MSNLQIKEGGFYADEIGRKHGPMRPCPIYTGGVGFGAAGETGLWNADGSPVFPGAFDSPRLVAEWAEPEHTEVDLRDIADQPEAFEPPPAYAPLPAGLTKREWFAGQALPALISAGAAGLSASRAVAHADALLAELAKETV